MALIDDVKNILANLAPHGWKELFAQHGLDIGASNLDDELTKDISPDIDRTATGFQDFNIKGKSAITSGIPSQSLLYHGLASPAVSASIISKYPSLEQLDTIENYIYSLVGISIEKLISTFGENNLKICVIASEYRVGNRTPHKRYADVVFSRTGISRVGNKKENYDAERRSFWGANHNQREEINVMPARFNTYICVNSKISSIDSVLDSQLDQFNNFLFPVHKLFSGTECIQKSNTGLDLNLKYKEFHLQEKLHKCHELSVDKGGLDIDKTIFDINSSPFIRTSITDDLVVLSENGSLCKLSPEVRPIVEFAKQNGQYVTYKATPRTLIRGRSSRFISSLQIPAFDSGPRRDIRVAPEYVNMRFELGQNNKPVSFSDLNLSNADYTDKVLQQKIEPVHVFDNTCEGSINVTGLNQLGLDLKPAFSVVSAIDFFPLVDQYEIDKFITGSSNTLGVSFPQGGTKPLSSGRSALCPSIEDPINLGNSAFSSSENTITSIVSSVNSIDSQLPKAPVLKETATSYLPDAASNVFAPGWDLSTSGKIDINGNVTDTFLSVSGLGSPFPEDAKLCAALNSFWPAAAPDASRTFANGLTVKPLTEVEVGVHSDHPFKLKLGGSTLGWDGEFGPFFQNFGGNEFVNFSDIFFSDYVDNALKNKVSVSPLSDITTDELIRRMTFLRDAYLRLDGFQSRDRNDRFEFKMEELHLVTFDVVPDWNLSYPGRIGNSLQGSGYRFIFAQTGQASPASEQGRAIAPVINKFELQYDFSNVFEYKIN